MTTTIAGVTFHYDCMGPRAILHARITDIDQQLGHLFRVAEQAEDVGNATLVEMVDSLCATLEAQRAQLQAQASRLPQEPPQRVTALEV